LNRFAGRREAQSAKFGRREQSMAVVVQGQGQGLGPAEYDALLGAVDWENQPAPGGIFHRVV
jgi:hypothetical protein